MLQVFCNLNLYFLPDSTIFITPLSALKKQIFSLMKMPDSLVPGKRRHTHASRICVSNFWSCCIIRADCQHCSVIEKFLQHNLPKHICNLKSFMKVEKQVKKPGFFNSTARKFKVKKPIITTYLPLPKSFGLVIVSEQDLW